MRRDDSPLATVDQKIDKLTGQLIRAVDERARACGGQGPRHKVCLAVLAMFLAKWKDWKGTGRDAR